MSKGTKKDQENASKLFNSLLKEQKLPLIVSNQSGSVTYINQSFSRYFGWTSEDVVGQPLTIIIPPHLRDAHHLGFSRFLTTEQPTLLNKPLLLAIITKEGKQLNAEHLILACKKNGEWNFAATITPVEE